MARLAARVVYERPAAFARRTASAIPCVHGSPWPGRTRSTDRRRERVERTERLRRIVVQAVRSDLRTRATGERVPRREGVAGDQGALLFQEDRAASVGVARYVHHARPPRHVDRVPVAERGDLVDRHDLQPFAAHQPEQGAVRLESEEVLAEARFVLGGRAGSGRLGVGPVDPDGGLGLRPRPFREARVVAVRVGQQDGIQIGQRPAERTDGLFERLPVARRTRVDQREFGAVLDEVEVDDALRQPVDSVRDLHVRIVVRFRLTLVGGPSYGEPYG